MNSKSLRLWDLATISTDIEKRRQVPCVCDSCGEKPSTFLYVVKLLLYGIFHVCETCKCELEVIADKRNTCFVKK